MSHKSVKHKKLTDYAPNPQNSNTGSERGQGMIENSFRKYGAGRSLLVDKNNKIIAGNHSQEGALETGLENVIEVETDGTQVVVVKRSDLDLSDTDDMRAVELAYIDNRSNEVSLNWDAAQIMADVEAGADLSGMFTEIEIAELIASQTDLGPSDPDAGAQVDRAEELNEKWKVSYGDLWIISSKHGGEHRLLCGDSTVKDDVDRVIDGLVTPLMVTDPPYGVEYDPSWRVDVDGGTRHALGVVKNDDNASWLDTWQLAPCDVAYVWHAGIYGHIVATDLLAAGFNIRSQIIWNKHQFALSRGHYHWKHEPCWYAVKQNKTGHWIGDRKQTTMWDIASLNPAGGLKDEEATGHGTQKPIECMSRPISNHSGNVYDPFGGSGTTMVACEQLGRQCRMIEIEPKYVAVILERMSGMGLEPKKADVEKHIPTD